MNMLEYCEDLELFDHFVKRLYSYAEGTNLFDRSKFVYKSVGVKRITQRVRDMPWLPTYLCQDVSSPSDLRLKTDVARIGGALGRLRRIGGVTYRWNELGLDYLSRGAAEGVSAGPGATPEQDRAVRQRLLQRRRDELAGT